LCDSLPPSTTDLPCSLKTAPTCNATDMPHHDKNPLNTRNPKPLTSQTQQLPRTDTGKPCKNVGKFKRSNPGHPTSTPKLRPDGALGLFTKPCSHGKRLGAAKSPTPATLHFHRRHQRQSLYAASPCSARSRPANSTFWVTRSPTSASVSLNKITLTIPLHTAVMRAAPSCVPSWLAIENSGG